METDETCGQFYGPYNITAYSSCTSTDSGVAQVSGSSINMVNEGECTINVNHLASTFTRPPVGDCDLSGCGNNCTETDTEMTEPVQTSVRTPHHLVVVSNTQFTLGCGSPEPVEQHIKYTVVDVSGRPVGRSRVQELFLAESRNTCGNGQPNPTSCGVLSLTSQFTDFLTVNCNNVDGSCGYDLCWQWQWCPSGRTPVGLATFEGTIHYDQVTVTGFTVTGSTTSVTAGTPVYPVDGNPCP